MYYYLYLNITTINRLNGFLGPVPANYKPPPKYDIHQHGGLHTPQRVWTKSTFHLFIGDYNLSRWDTYLSSSVIKKN